MKSDEGVQYGARRKINEGDEGRLGGGLIQPLFSADRKRELHTKEAVLLGVMK